MPVFERYAVYVTPTGGLARFGASWLGWDSARGCAVAHPDVDGIDVARMTERPRKYGLHGTIKPPFFLAEGCSYDRLRDALEDLCETLSPVRLPGLELTALGRFLALIPTGDTADLVDLASSVVAGLDRFRAPPSPAELKRRNRQALSPRHLQNLERWGYPYVMEDFRFHITLTGPLAQGDRDRCQSVLAPLVAPFLTAPFLIDRMTLCGQDTNGLFHQICHVPLQGQGLS